MAQETRASGMTTDPVKMPTDARGRLSGTMGAVGLVLTVLAFNGPLTVVVGFVPAVIGYGNGLGAPVAFLLASVIIGLFAVGFTTMGRSLPNPGAFYAYITAGLGRPAGLGGSYLALLSYFFILAGVFAFGGISLAALVSGTLNGPDVSWWVYSLAMIAVDAVLGYRQIEISVRVLTVLLLAEIVLILIFDAAVVLRGGHDGLGVSSFEPHEFTSGSVGLALLFTITCFSGFEATAIFREEVREPNRTIPLATYGAVATIGLLYTVGTWVMIQATGADTVVSASSDDPTGTFYSALHTFVGQAAVDIVTVILCTSIFAASLATHNVATRYVYNLAKDEIFPGNLATVHPRFGSPSRASVVTSGVIAAVIVLLVLFDADPAKLYAILVGLGGYALILLLLVTSVAIIAYLRRAAVVGTTAWHTTVAPGLSAAGLGVAAVLATQKLDVLIGGSERLAMWMLALTIAVSAAGVFHAVVLRAKGSPAYARIGRQEG